MDTFISLTYRKQHRCQRNQINRDILLNESFFFLLDIGYQVSDNLIHKIGINIQCIVKFLILNHILKIFPNNNG